MGNSFTLLVEGVNKMKEHEIEKNVFVYLNCV